MVGRMVSISASALDVPFIKGFFIVDRLAEYV